MPRPTIVEEGRGRNPAIGRLDQWPRQFLEVSSWSWSATPSPVPVGRLGDPVTVLLLGSPNFIFDIGPDDPVIVYTFAVSLGDQAAGDLSVIYPFAALQPLLDEVNVGTVEPPTIFEPSVVQLEEVEVELLALIGPTSVAVGDFLSLQPGDVLVLDQWADQPSIGMVHGVPLLELSVGASSGHVAAVVERWKE